MSIAFTYYAIVVLREVLVAPTSGVEVGWSSASGVERDRVCIMNGQSMESAVQTSCLGVCSIPHEHFLP